MREIIRGPIYETEDGSKFEHRANAIDHEARTKLAELGL